MTSMLVAAAILVGVPTEPAGEDDLTVVRRAVAVRTDRPAPAPPKAPDRITARARKDERPPQWLRLRVVEKGSRRARVSVNVPLALVRALGDECPLSWCGRGAKGRAEEDGLRLSDVLAALESGQALVEVDHEDATVRVWVD